MTRVGEETNMKIAVIWILWAIAVGNDKSVWVPHESFETRAERVQAQTRGREALRNSQKVETGSFSLACLPDTIQPPR